MKNRTSLLLTALIVCGITIFYLMQIEISPILGVVATYYGITNDALINLAVVIIYPTIVVGCLTGGLLEKKIGTRLLYSVCLFLIGSGLLLNLAATSSYLVLLLGRLICGFGFGFGIQFIGSAIMRWYPAKARETMDTVNGLFPYVGTMICFLIMMPLYYLLGSNCQMTLAFFGFIVLIILALWTIFIRDSNLPDYSVHAEQQVKEKGIFRKLLAKQEMRLLCVAFICDICCYTYISVIFPTLIFEAGGMSESVANVLAAIFFPAMGIIGCLTGGYIMKRTGHRKKLLLMGQILELTGILVATLLAGQSVIFIILGIAIFGFGNGLWMPPLYCVPMDLQGMTPSLVGGAFAMINAAGLPFGFIMPTIGGALTTLLMNVSGIVDPLACHVFGLRWSLFLFGFVNILGIIAMIRMPETGPGRIKKVLGK